MADSRRLRIVIKIVLTAIFFILIDLTNYIIYSYDIENKSFNLCKGNVKFVVSGLELLKPGLTEGNVKLKELQKNIASLSAYYKIERKLHLLVYKRDTGAIIYPIYSENRRVDKRINLIVKTGIEGRIETDDKIGYYLYYKPANMAIVIYKNKYELFHYRNILLISITGLLVLLIIILIIIDIKKNREDLKYFRIISDKFKHSINLVKGTVDLKEIGNEVFNDRLKDSLIQSYNRMIKSINILLKRQKSRIREISKQRGNLRKLAYYYKKYTSEIPNSESINEAFVEKFSNKRIPVTSLSIGLINYFNQIEGVYPEVINRELESFYRYVASIIKSRGGFINYYEGNFLNIDFGLLPEDEGQYKNFFYLATSTAKDVHNWITNRNKVKNVTGVMWEEAMGITSGNSITGVVGNNLIIIGDVVERSKQMMRYSEKYGASCITDSINWIKDSDFKYRILDKIKDKTKGDYRVLYEIFIEEREHLEDAIKLYQHGLEMYFEEKYEISVTEFKKVNQLFNPDKPSKIFLSRINSMSLP